MPYVLAGAFVLVALVVLGRAFVTTDPRALIRFIRYFVGIFLIIVGAILLLAERWGLAVPAIAAGISAISIGRIGPIDLGGSYRSAGQRSGVTSRWLEMSLDHDTGAMNGTVRQGTYAGKKLDDLDEEALRALYGELASDRESRDLFEAYLDRRLPGWREDGEADGDAGPRGAADAGPMTDQEAYQVLGLAPGATDAEIREAHRRLMMRVHPDVGGTERLAAKVNEAKDRLLGKHR
ncbi:MAG: DnaJ domain-containing protein [Rhizobiales bacterium]|nr:DnaJ domain-containing protein [Hyphomicrobiales bacterium]